MSDPVPSIHDQFEDIWNFVHEKCEEEAKLILTHASDSEAPACEMLKDKPVQILDPDHCGCAQCRLSKDCDTPPIKQCIFCHYGYHEKPQLLHGLFGATFVRCPNCGKQHTWEYQ